MKQLRSLHKNLKRLFEHNITVREIAEPLVSFDENFQAKDALRFMNETNFDVVGVRERGVISGYVNRENLKDGTVKDNLRAFEENDLVLESEPMHVAMKALKDRPAVFVSMLGQVGGIVTRGDLQKAPVRMWIFGLITLIEMQLLRLIRERYPDGSWERLLTKERHAAAYKIYKDRKRKNEEIEISDCLQLCDKASVLCNDRDIIKALGFGSKTKATEFFGLLQKTRDRLAHANNIIDNKWPRLATLVFEAEGVLQQLESISLVKGKEVGFFHITS